MNCERFRDAVSARLDGEPLGLSASALDHHLATCADCARWAEAAARVTRQLRVGRADVPDLTGQIMAAAVLPARRVLRRRLLLRLALVLAGVVQLGVAAPALFGDSLGMAMAVHAAHENAAWNLALGAAFLVVAVVPRRAAGLLPVLVVFVGALAVLSIRDVASGAVGLGRLATHLGVLAGLVLVAALYRAERSLPPERATVVGDEESPAGRGGVRGAA